MSLLFELKRWIDRNAFEREQAEAKQWQSLILKGDPGDGGDATQRPAPPPATPGECRVCATQVEGQRWCPRCLAYTVKPRKK